FADIQTGNGVIGAAGSDAIVGAHIYNNTIVGNQSSSFLYQNNPAAGSGSGNVVKNNLFYDSNGTFPQVGAGSIDYGDNAFFSCSQLDSGATDQVSNGIPFVNLGAGDYHLTSGTEPGLSLGAPYGMDMDGKVRGQDGTWDRGAFEYP